MRDRPDQMEHLHPNSPGFNEGGSSTLAGDEGHLSVAARVQAGLDRAALVRAGLRLDRARARRDWLRRESQEEEQGGRLRATEIEVRAARRAYRWMFDRVTGLDWREVIGRLTDDDFRLAA